MNDYIVLAIKALEQMKATVPPGVTWRSAVHQAMQEIAIEEAIAYMRTMDNTIHIQVERIVELQRQLMKAEEALALALGSP
jgi:hypothetical protein